MKREDLKKLGIEDEKILDAVMELHGKDIETHKGKLDAATSELKDIKTQLADAGKQIESFKGMDIDGIKKAADDWKAKAEQAEKDFNTRVSALRFDHALSDALNAAKVKNPKAVKALLDVDGLKFNEKDDSFLGLDDQLKKLRESDAYLFADAKEPPKIVTGGTPPMPGNDNVTFADAIGQRLKQQTKG